MLLVSEHNQIKQILQKKQETHKKKFVITIKYIYYYMTKVFDDLHYFLF